ncbi:FAD-dependent oxidoreductase [Nocardioidaceae bacterium]|nr:FAD-dependent oxidoreductase [Nocardioidaceae bacterium]
METDVDLVVVGAGLAGVRTALAAEEAGLEVRVLEASHRVGGRIVTDVVEGFRCDRGFQLLNPAYPAVKRFVDIAALGLQQFGAGVLVRRDDGLHALGDPRRAPQHLLSTLRSGLISPRELIGIARWIAPALARPQAVADRDAGPEGGLYDTWQRLGITGPLRREVLEPFLGGTLSTSRGDTSAAFVSLLLRSFVLGTPGLPRGGMQAFPEQLASRLRTPVSLETPVTGVEERDGGVRVATDGGAVTARACVVAVGPEKVPGLLPDHREIPTNSLHTWWFEADALPHDSDLLVLDGRAVRPPGGPVQHAAVVSNAAPSYAPPGRHLVQATVLPDRVEGGGTESAVRAHLAGIYGVSTRGWELLVHHEVAPALPAQLPPLRIAREQRVGEAVWVAGDHTDSASIQGALVAGERAGAAVVEALA